MLKVSLLGTPIFEREGHPFPLQRRKAIALFAYLALARNPLSREKLATSLWPEAGQSAALKNLRRDLSHLKQAVGEQALQANRLQIELIPHAGFEIDTARFEERLDAVSRHNHFPQTPCQSCLENLETAVTLYRGDFLSGFTLADSPEFDDWQYVTREMLRQRLADALQKLIGWHRQHHAWEPALSHCRRWVSLDPLHEEAQRTLMTLLAQAGQATKAQKRYLIFKALLEEELGVGPEAETIERYEEIRNHTFPPPLKRPETLPNVDRPVQILQPAPAEGSQLPRQTTSFVGRQKELKEIKRLLLDEASCRLLTLLGPGGMGKTRLGLKSASELASQFEHGVCYITLSALEDPHLLPVTIAKALQVRLHNDLPPEDQLLTFLHDRELLLLVDNLETQPAADQFLSQCVTFAPRIKILATSRQRLNIQEEWVYDVNGLDLPPPDTLDQDELIAPFSAVQLFVHRARQSMATFKLTPAEIGAVREICQAVGGMPLALELAAGWVSTLSCVEIASELEQNLDILATGLHNIQDRHRDLKFVFDQSWSLLTPSQQTSFARLSIFGSQFTRQAASQITQITLIDLSHLVGKSLLRRLPNGRYEIHQILHQYARRKLQAESGEMLIDLADRHARFYGELLHSIEPELNGPKQRDRLLQLELEYENLRLGWSHLISRLRDPAWHPVLRQYARPLFTFFDTHSLFRDGARAFDGALDALQQTETADNLLGMMMGRQAWFDFHIGSVEQAEDLFKAGLALLQAGDGSDNSDRGETIFIHNYLGALYRHLGRYPEAQSELERALEIARDQHDQFGASVAVNILGQIAYQQGRYAEAEQLCEEALALKRAVGDRWGMCYSLTYLGLVARALDDLSAAEDRFSQSLAISTEIGDRRGVATSQSQLGDLALRQADYERAETYFKKSYRLFEAINNRLGRLSTLARLSDVAREQNNLELAWEWLSAGLKLAQTGKTTPQVLDLLTSVAAWQWAMQNKAGATSTLASPLAHPATSEATRRRAASLWQEMAALAPASLPTGFTSSDHEISEHIRLLLNKREMW
ncbi:MAG: tetratricopeptide repeat protein [Chloroflexota bacterium]